MRKHLNKITSLRCSIDEKNESNDWQRKRSRYYCFPEFEDGQDEQRCNPNRYSSVKTGWVSTPWDKTSSICWIYQTTTTFNSYLFHESSYPTLKYFLRIISMASSLNAISHPSSSSLFYSSLHRVLYFFLFSSVISTPPPYHLVLYKRLS